MNLIKKYFSVLLCIILIGSLFYIGVNSVSLGISASSAVVMVAQTGEVLYEHNAHKKRSMASTTKIMTSLIVLEKADLKKEITVKKEELNVEGTSMGLLPDDKVTFEGLVYGMLLQSGNDAANVTASKLGGNIDNFVKMMNRRARELGMNSTNFVTPSGLDDDEHYSTAYDMALLGSAAVMNPDFRHISSQKQAAVYYGNPPYRRVLTNHNKMLRSYDGCVGLKTGYTKKSGRCLVTAAERGGVTIVAVTLNAPNDWNDHKVLLDYGFSKAENRPLDNNTDSLKIPVTGGKNSVVSVEVKNKAFVNISENTQGISSHYILEPFLYAPVKKGDIVGKIVYFTSSQKVGEVILEASENVSAKEVIKKKSLWRKFVDFVKSIFK